MHFEYGEPSSEILPDLVNVEYDVDRQKKAIATVLQQALKFCREEMPKDQVPETLVPRIRSLIRGPLTELLLRFKHPGFKREAEWRLVFSLPRDDPNIDYHTNKLGLVPHVLLRIVPKAGVYAGRLPIRSVVQGPTAESELAKNALVDFLRKYGYSAFTEVSASTIPLRF